MIEKVLHKNKLFALIVRRQFRKKSGINFFTSKEATQQNENKSQPDTLTYIVYGMGCPGCEGGLEKQVNKIPAVKYSKANWVKQELIVVVRQDSILNKNGNTVHNWDKYIIELQYNKHVILLQKIPENNIPNLSLNLNATDVDGDTGFTFNVSSESDDVNVNISENVLVKSKFAKPPLPPAPSKAA